MSVRPVEWVLVIRYVLSTHRAVYGRFAGSTKYTKDYIQLYNNPDFIKQLTVAFPALSQGSSVSIEYRWPKGSSSGTIFRKSADRPHLTWETKDGAPAPWKMADNPDASSVETIRGDPSRTAEGPADSEYDALFSSGFGQPFLIAVKLSGEDKALHLSVLIENAEPKFGWADLKNAPLEIQDLVEATSPRTALAWRSFAPGDGSQRLYFDPSNKADAWAIGDSGSSNGGWLAGRSSVTQPSPEASDLDSDLFAEGLDHSEEEVSEFQRRLISGDYEVPDTFANKKTRGSAQRAFAAEVKKNYGWTCALTGIQTREFLIASHIVPWSVDEKIRLDPSNGICLSVLVDRAFENGILIVKDDFTVTVNRQEVGGDVELMKQLQAYDGMKLDLPKAHPPKVEYLKRRRSL